MTWLAYSLRTDLISGDLNVATYANLSHTVNSFFKQLSSHIYIADLTGVLLNLTVPQSSTNNRGNNLKI